MGIKETYPYVSDPEINVQICSPESCNDQVFFQQQLKGTEYLDKALIKVMSC